MGVSPPPHVPGETPICVTTEPFGPFLVGDQATMSFDMTGAGGKAGIVADDDGKARAEHYRAKAAKVYAIANEMTDPEARRAMRQMALTYERLARGVEGWRQQPVVPTFISHKK